ncbi:MAG: dCTP deaminase [Halobacteria archaeon]|nr:dCTP deaminase [Halobacteria archaeon]
MSDVTEYVTDVLHEETQVHEGGVDLSLGEVYVVDEPGRVDFGGGELEDPELEEHPTRKRNPDDDYAWWNLESGTYLMEYNEGLEPGDADLRLQTRRELLERGASHPSLVLRPETYDGLPRMCFTVSEGGIRIKENARVSTVSLE